MTSHFRTILTTTAAIGLFTAGNALAESRTDLILGMSVEPSGLDPTSAAPVAIGQVVWQNLFEGLVTIDKNGEIKPELAEKWTISDDGLTYTFDLREGVTFQNGKAFNATTAKYTLDRMLSNDSVNPQKSLFKSIESVQAADAGTLILKLSKPSADLLYWLGFPSAVMVEPSSEATNATDPVGTGPF
ncbi:MAG: ABC transporter substrate-binding protein, partial [Alphaproteobacteria bacterium]|nr:ABC transporter substrate-binding protein [Alphaproteobacteria bacterium]